MCMNKHVKQIIHAQTCHKTNLACCAMNSVSLMTEGRRASLDSKVSMLRREKGAGGRTNTDGATGVTQRARRFSIRAAANQENNNNKIKTNYL